VAALRAELEAQVTALFLDGRADAPHAYVQVWVGLRRYQERAGWRPLPGPGGWLDQDAELMWALEECDRVWGELDAERRGREAAQAALAGMVGAPAPAAPAPAPAAPSANGVGRTPLRLTGAFE
jgi:hypothetical protein